MTTMNTPSPGAGAPASAKNSDAALIAPTPPEGGVLVPREPTPEMLAAGWSKVTHGLTSGSDYHLSKLWRAMLSAAPPISPRGVSEAEHHRDLLGEALGKLLVHIGMVRADAAMTGPELLMAVDTYCEGPPALSSEAGS